MKKTLLFLFILCTVAASAQDYKKEWAEVLEKETEGEVKQAAALTDLIYQKAHRKKNQSQVIKAFFFKAKYMQVLEEDAQFKIISNIRAEIKKAPHQGKAILNSIYAQMLRTIYRKNRYAINNISKTANYDINDYRKWDSKNFEDEIEKAYIESLEPADLLYRTPLTDFEEIIDFAPSLRNLERSLYDFLAECYLNDLWDTTSLANNEYANNHVSLLFGDTEHFLKFTESDSLTITEKKGITLLTEIEKHYYNNNDTINLDRAVLRRLEYMDYEILGNQKIPVYLATIHNIANKTHKTPITYIAKLVEAQTLVRQSDKTLFNQNIVESIKLCDELIVNKDKHDLTPDAINLKNNYLQKEAFIETESFIKPNATSLAQIRFKNLDSINVLFYKIPHNADTEAASFRSQYITNKKPVVKKAYKLPNRNDHFTYTTEVLLPALTKGTYAIILSAAEENIEPISDPLIEKITASQIAVLDQHNYNITTYQVVDRSNGKPIKNAKASLANFSDKTSDINGRIQYIARESRWNNNAERDPVTITWQGDTISFGAYINDYRPDKRDLISRIQLFTDRSIYRPGQTVYFKGIAYKDYKGVFSVIPNRYFTVTVESSRNDELKKIRLKTNEFGSFADSIVLPKNINGRFEITVDEDEEDEDEDPLWEDAYFSQTSVFFNVEEYKRPTFEVTFEKIKDQIRLNEVIKIKGTARTLSSAMISNADVEYRVYRKSRRHWYDENYNSYEGEITNGDTITDANGQFVIEFMAEPDKNHKPEELPFYTYEISVDVTDINGETHSERYSVNVGYHAQNIYANLPHEINANQKATIKLGTSTLNGEFVPASGVVNIYKTLSPEKIYNERPFADPEIQTISKEEFELHLPYIPFKTFKDSVLRQNPVLSQKVNTGLSKELVLEKLEYWQSGEYEILFTATDSLGNEISYDQRFILKKNSDKIPSDKKLFEYEIKNKDYEKDGYVEIEFTSGLPLSVNIMAQSDQTMLFDKQIEVNATKKNIHIPVFKNPRTNMFILLSYVWQNKYHNEELSLVVPRKTEKLSIETQTLTTKLLPASPQTWSFSIQGSKSPLEILASMYDASLDRLDTEDEYMLSGWNDLDTNSYLSNYLRRNITTTGTTSTSFTQKPKYQMLTKKSDSFYRYGFDFDSAKNSYYLYAPKTQAKNLDGYTVYGVVTDETGMPIPGANVMIKGTNQGVQTDFDGNYGLYANIGETVVFSYVGMESQSAVVLGRNIDVRLKDSAMHLDDIIVEAYRTTTRATSNIAVTTVTSKTIEGRPNANFIQTLQGQVPGLQISTGSGQPGASSTVVLRGVGSINGTAQPLYVIDGVPLSENDFKNLSEDEIADLSIIKDNEQTAAYGARGANGVVIITTKQGMESLQQVKARKNFNETAFFYPQIHTDKKGRFSFSFTTPEALTEWKLRMLAHNKNAASGYYENTFITQKDLMIVPNMPRFLREMDTIVLIAKVTNLTNEVKTGNTLLQLFDASTMQPADAQMMNSNNLKPFTIPAKGNTTVSWKITVPKGMQGVQYKVLAKAGDFTDGEENILPVLTNSIMVTESIPLWVKPNSINTYAFDKFEESLSKPSITQLGMTLEYTSNPAWLALQSLPYLMEFEHECAEQVFSRYYANSIASHILNSSPKIAEVFAAWRKADKPLSKFEQNEELKSIIMAETPWVLDNQSDEEIKNRLALLFDFDKLKVSLEANFTKLENKQASSGGFPWFDGGKESYYITRHIAAGFGHLNKLGIKPENKNAVDIITRKAVLFMDYEFLNDYESRKTSDKKYTVEIPFDGLHYLYARSFYAEQYPMPENLKKITDDYINSINKSTAYTKYKWLEYSLYQKGMLALVLNRYGYKDMAKKILNHLKETSSTNGDWGMYWIENKAGWHWHQAPVETQALLIEAFIEVDNDIAAADAMKVWLLKNKQNKNWPTTKATTEAVYALLMQGSDWLSVKDNTVFSLGDKKNFDAKLASNEKEAGTGYIKLQWKADEIKTGMGTLHVENKSAVPGYGGLYWQRNYEEADKDYVPQEGILTVTKELYSKVNTADGPLLKPVSKSSLLKTGDLVTVRLIINTKEDMEYLHLKDMRASAFEPVDVISKRKYIGGTNYYQSTKDAATNFFFDSLNKGLYIIEYDVRVNNAGDFSNGIATIQSMYAPEFKGNSKATRINIEP